mgnify:CR=1 FL=1
MSFWTFVFAISVAGMVFSYLMRRKELQHGVSHRSESGSQTLIIGGASKATLESIEKKLEQMERRLESLETIVIERERHNEFDRALNH